MYGPKKTPHFISKNQLLPFPNLAHLLKAQDQGAGSDKKWNKMFNVVLQRYFYDNSFDEKL